MSPKVNSEWFGGAKLQRVGEIKEPMKWDGR